MASTTYVQFLKGGLLIVFSLVLVVVVCLRGLSTHPPGSTDHPYYQHRILHSAGTEALRYARAGGTGRSGVHLSSASRSTSDGLA